jgi:hypothetical protein
MDTNKEYISNGGNTCPSCHSENITGGQVEVDSNSAWQPVTCNECQATWNDTYTLTGFAEFEHGDACPDCGCDTKVEMVDDDVGHGLHEERKCTECSWGE